jgi:hypothetical protein
VYARTVRVNASLEDAHRLAIANTIVLAFLVEDIASSPALRDDMCAAGQNGM